MSRPEFVYVHDALCSWCYGFDSVMAQVQRDFGDRARTVLVSGGMNLGDERRIKDVLGDNYRAIYQRVIDTSGADIGPAYLDGLVGRDNYRLDSERPAIALSAFRAHAEHGDQQLQFVTRMQTGMYRDGLDPNHDAYYRAAAEGFGIDPDAFLEQMREPSMREDAYEDFRLTQQLQVRGFPHLFVRDADQRDYVLLTRGYAGYDELKPRVAAGLRDLEQRA